MLRRIRSLLDRGVADLAYAALWKLGGRFRTPSAAHEAIFTRIYQRKEWGDGETRSGPGSTRARGDAIRADLIDLFERFSIASVLDAPCGDFNWMCAVTAETAVSYIGVDVVRELIERNARLHGDDRHRFLCADLTRDPLPAADLILCRDALVHFSFTDIASALRNFQRSGARFLLTTTFAELARNEDIRTGGWRALNLEKPPFEFPPPIAMIADVPHSPPGAGPDKRLALWDVAALRIPR